MSEFRDRIKDFRRVPAASLKPSPRNWRTHPAAQREALEAMLGRVGIADAAIARELPDGSLELIDGHLRADVLTGDIPVLVLDVDQAEADQLLATLDPLAGMAGTDGEKLNALLAGFAGGAGLDEMLDALREKADEAMPEPVFQSDPDEVPEVREAASARRGDLIVLGAHRLLCGDSTNADDVARLMDGAKINVAVTSPPYASQRTYDETSGFKPIPPDEYMEWFAPVAASIAAHIAQDGSYFLNIKEHCEDGQRSLYVKDLTLAHAREWGWKFIDEFCWARAGVPGGWPNRFKNGWEPVFHFALADSIKFRPEAVSHKSEHVFDYSAANGKSVSGSGLLGKEHGTRFMDGLARPSNVLDIGSGGAKVSGEHPAEYPIGVPSFFILAFSDAGDVIYDPFMGSGTTLIAAEQLGRRAFGMEISPQYVDVIVRRWQTFTGKKAGGWRGNGLA